MSEIEPRQGTSGDGLAQGTRLPSNGGLEGVDRDTAAASSDLRKKRRFGLASELLNSLFVIFLLPAALAIAWRFSGDTGPSAASARSPEFKVWTEQTHIPPNDDAYDLLYIQSREDEPVILKKVLMNDDPKCVNMSLSTYEKDKPLKLGEVIRFALGLHGSSACTPVRVLISTDRGDSTYQFK
ncbi:hypothetical protein [Bradyrhizobium elkanii]|uniref:hypothetical protein n=1 Tax=Bradyrhizobium elkanii TaxID=29448 RepID=UPI00209ED3DB|nr:hypothetical protein [Bradyrhizobium elkanii]MCP1974269.1 hypothetical protein [Bradyrhizobium elkanii]MCS4104225.1 hypothetical protein [Bradyrhizobium elkanii]